VADVRPFRAVRYARPSADVTAPPYDVIDDDALELLRERDAHNIVHLTLAADPAEAAERLRAWLAEGVLVRDAEPAAWFLEQEYVGPDGVARRRDGIVASLRAEPYATGAVLPHERTHAAAIEGRLRLLRATRVQLEPIFLLYDGRAPLARPAAPPDLAVEGTRLWRLENAHGIEEFFAERQLLIADGHHRYETAVAFAAEDDADRLLAVLVSTSDPGLEVFPTHRVFNDRPDIDPPGDPVPSVEDALAALDAAKNGTLAFVRGPDARLLHAESGELDVDLVDRFGHEGIVYTPDREDAVERVRSGRADCVFLLRPPQVADVFERARRGRPLPQKTTYFFPKLVSGLLLHPVDP
jgi:uncharacterized protein (DUF1015 family)